MSVTVKIKGLDELEKKLYDLPSKFAKRAMRGALKPAASIWKEEIAATAPEKTGWLKSQAAVSIKLSAKEESGTALVGFTKKQNPERLGKEKHTPSAANEAFWYEMGTFRQKAQPFMRRAYESMKEKVLETFVAKLKEAFNEVFGR
jgi:HK97 gp10 family phage protein